ncbi:MAG: hypothetical protein GXX85_10780 [Ignavibacteria bacterium]|nr:hypothetical protein [Ignavibacteria bacterium]
MGQQQLLLIVLGVIIVGIAIVVGINLFNAQSEESAKDAMVAAATNIGAMAQQFYKKPVQMGGGGGVFTKFKIPTGLSSDANGKYVATPTATSVTIVGTPDKAFGYSFKNITTTVTADTLYSTIN